MCGTTLNTKCFCFAAQTDSNNKKVVIVIDDSNDYDTNSAQ